MSGWDEAISHRPATSADAPVLAEMNQQLIADERHRNPMTVPELEGRMRGMLSGSYVATLFEREAEPIAYALWRDEPEYVYLRQFFVARAHRRQGVGRQALHILTGDAWPPGKRVRVNVLVGNVAGLAFWRAVGFGDYLITLEMEPTNLPSSIISQETTHGSAILLGGAHAYAMSSVGNSRTGAISLPSAMAGA